MNNNPIIIENGDIYRAQSLQLEDWVNGEPRHIVDPENPQKKFCCPDGSCCFPDLLASMNERMEYKEGTEYWRHGMDEIFSWRIKENKKMNHSFTKCTVAGDTPSAKAYGAFAASYEQFLFVKRRLDDLLAKSEETGTPFLVMQEGRDLFDDLLESHEIAAVNWRRYQEEKFKESR